MKKSLFFASIAVLAMSLASCGGSNQKAAEEETPEVAVITVDQLYADADALVGDTVVVEGVCAHLCAHGGRKAFLAGSADSLIIRSEAFPLMGESFPTSTVNHSMRLTGVVRETRIDEEAIQQMEKDFAERVESVAKTDGEESAELVAKAASGCDTERAAQGQKEISTFNDRMADYRARIAARQEKEGIPYLSFYYIDAISYVTLDE
ncbi:MAG: hypothetical protein NC098_03145 [Lachnoclostridium sp.]|nr:hypothetical protein [Lachnoclostridium sp.]